MGHRGASAIAPENTLAAFRACKEHGVNWFEFDVGVIADGTAVVIHDNTLDRTTDATGLVDNLTAADLATIDAGSWFSPEFAGERIPTLRQVIELMNELELDANLEIKASSQPRLLAAVVMTELERLDPARHVIISSFDPRLLARVYRALPRWNRRSNRASLEIGYLFSAPQMARIWRAVGLSTHAAAMHPWEKTLTAEKVAVYKRAGFAVNTWTVNDADRARELAAWGVDAVISDNPHLMPTEWLHG